MYKTTFTSNGRNINPQSRSNNTYGLESTSTGQVGYTRMTTADRKPFVERNTFQNHSFLTSNATSSEPMSEYLDSELQLPMPHNTSYPSPIVRNANRPSSMAWNVSGPIQIAQNHQFAAPTTPSPYQRTPHTNLVNSPYEQNVVQEYYNPMMRGQGQSKLPMMNIAQSPSGQMRQHEMSSRTQVQDARFSPYSRPPIHARATTPSSLASNQTFMMHSTTGSFLLPPSTSKSDTAKLTKATSTAKPKKRNNPTAANDHRFFAGTIEQIVRWYKIARQADLHVIYKTAGVLESVSRGKWGENVMVLRDHREPEERLDEGAAGAGRPLQLVFFPVDRELPPGIVVGQLITCVGRMLGENKLQVLDAEPTTVDALVGLKRVSFLCQWALQDVA